MDLEESWVYEDGLICFQAVRIRSICNHAVLPATPEQRGYGAAKGRPVRTARAGWFDGAEGSRSELEWHLDHRAAQGKVSRWTCREDRGSGRSGVHKGCRRRRAQLGTVADSRKAHLLRPRFTLRNRSGSRAAHWRWTAHRRRTGRRRTHRRAGGRTGRRPAARRRQDGIHNGCRQ